MAQWYAGGCQGFDCQVVEEGSEAEITLGVYTSASLRVEEFEGLDTGWNETLLHRRGYGMY